MAKTFSLPLQGHWDFGALGLRILRLSLCGVPIWLYLLQVKLKLTRRKNFPRTMGKVATISDIKSRDEPFLSRAEQSRADSQLEILGFPYREIIYHMDESNQEDHPQL